MPTFALRTLVRELVDDDDLRRRCPFSPQLRDATAALLAAETDQQRATVLAAWLTRYQPCIFGRLAAERELLSYCFLAADQLEASDQDIAATIQTKRRAWKSQAEDGRRSAFVILAASSKLAYARPDDTLMRFTLCLGGLYLGRQIEPDRIYLDRLRLWDLEFETRRQWRVGVNVFAAAGDGRWWNDHRIPGGVGFSMNSVGHLVAAEARRHAVQESVRVPAPRARRAGQVQEAEAALARLQETSVSSLGHALKYAMHTIRNASESAGGEGCPWGPATTLMRADPGTARAVPAVRNDAVLRDYSEDTYLGWYHTDVTVPSVYFRPDQNRPGDLKEPFALDLSYLHAGRGRDYRELAQGTRSDRVRRGRGRDRG